MIQHINPFIGVDGNGECLPGPYLPLGLVRLSPDTVAPHKTNGYRSADPIKHFSHTHVAGTGGMSRYGNLGVVPFTGAARLNVAPFDRVAEEAACAYYAVTTADSRIRCELTATARVGVHRYTFPADLTGPAHILFDVGAVIQPPFRATPSIPTAGPPTPPAASWNGSTPPPSSAAATTAAAGVTTRLTPSISTPSSTARPPNACSDKSARGSPTPAAARRPPAPARISPPSRPSPPAAKSTSASASPTSASPRPAPASPARSVKKPSPPSAPTPRPPGRNFSTACASRAVPPPSACFSPRFSRVFTACPPTSAWTTNSPPGTPASATSATSTASGIPSVTPTRSFPSSTPNSAPICSTASLMSGTKPAGCPTPGLPATPPSSRAAAPPPSSPARPRSKTPPASTTPTPSASSAATPRKPRPIPTTTAATSATTATSAMCRPPRPNACRDTLSIATRTGASPASPKRPATPLPPPTSKKAPKRSGISGEPTPAASPPAARTAPGTNPSTPNAAAAIRGTTRSSTKAPAANGPGTPTTISPASSSASAVPPHSSPPSTTSFSPTNTSPGRGYGVPTLRRRYHSKETMLHVPYLYHYVGRPDRSADAVRHALEASFHVNRDGLRDNEDMGCQSAFYLASTLGLYPVMGQDLYWLTTPVFTRSEITVGANDERLVIEAPDAGPSHPYIASATLDGQPLDRAWLRHAEIAKGAILRLTLSATPTAWGTTQPPPSPQSTSEAR